MSDPSDRPATIARWRRKFGDALDGMVHGIRTESSLRVHFAAGLGVIAVGAVLSLDAWRWAALLICIALVTSAEYFNSAIEQLVRSIDPGQRPEIAKVLHLAAAAVLVASVLAVAIGVIVLGQPLLLWLTAGNAR